MKGIIHIFEIVIVAMIVFIALFHFTYIPRMDADWGRTKIILQGWDVLFTLDEKGVDWLDPAEVETEMRKLFNQTNVQFGVTVKGAPPADISVGCICTSSQMNTIQNMLTNTNINGEIIRFNMTRILPTNISFPHDHDVIIMTGGALSTINYALGDYRREILNYLEEDKGLINVMVSEQARIDNSVHREIFGMVWNASLNPNTDPVFFTTSITAPQEYAIEKYFYHIPNSSGQTYPEPHQFTEIEMSTGKGWQKDNNTKKIVLTQTSTGTPACIINYGVSGGFGRTLWLSGLGASLTEDESVLMKSVVLWAAGDEYEVVESDIVTGIGKFSLFKTLNQNMYQPIEIVLELGYLY